MKKPRVTRTPEEKIRAIKEIYNNFVDATESFEVDEIGSFVAYIIGAIVNGGQVELDISRYHEAEVWTIWKRYSFHKRYPDLVSTFDSTRTEP